MAQPLPAARWTHVALPVSDLDRSIEFYTGLTPLVVVSRTSDQGGRGAWLSNDQRVDAPFVLVLAEFSPDAGRAFGIQAGAAVPTLRPFAHLGIELDSRAAVDAVAEQARARGALHWEPAQLAPHIGYVCAAVDPDGNVVEFSFDQNVAATVRAWWDARSSTPGSAEVPGAQGTGSQS
jgi:lactoylglutathione lyase